VSGGRDVPGVRSRLPVNAPAVIVFAVVVVGMVRVLTQHWREGAALLGGALLLAALLRVLLPSERAGLLAIRSRPVDVLIYLAFGGVLVLLALTIVKASSDLLT
jgi:Protein of unknown function (DUF3017)